MYIFEEWYRWDPIDNLMDNYYIESVADDPIGFCVMLSASKDENKKVSVLFKKSVFSYKRTNETFRLSIIGQ